MGVLIITHYQRILHLVEPDRVSIIFDGRDRQRGRPRARRAARARGLRQDPRGGRRGRGDEHARRHRRSRPTSPSSQREGLVYLDSAATSQKPRPVIDAMADFYERHHNASVHRGVYPLAVEATERFEGARDADRRVRWAGRRARRSSPATRRRRSTSSRRRGAARTSAPATASCVTEMEHHSIIVPWHMICRERGAQLDVVAIDDEGRLRLDVLDALLGDGAASSSPSRTSRTCSARSTRSTRSSRRAHAAGALSLVDGSQAVPQIPVDVAALDADFYAWTGHKAYGPTGIGVLHGRRELLEAMPPLLGGGHMIAVGLVRRDPLRRACRAKFEAGTSPIAEAIGLGAAVDLLDATRDGRDPRARARRSSPTRSSASPTCRACTIHGPPDADARGAVVSFALDHAHPHDVAEILGTPGRLRPRRPPLRAAAHEAPRRRPRRRAPRSPSTTPATTSTALVDGLDEVAADLRRERWTTSTASRSSSTTSGRTTGATLELDPDLEFEDNNPLCGDELKVDARASTTTAGSRTCASAATAARSRQASASLASDEVKGMTVDELLKLDRDFILELLGIDISRHAHEVRAAVAEGAQERRARRARSTGSPRRRRPRPRPARASPTGADKL